LAAPRRRGGHEPGVRSDHERRPRPRGARRGVARPRRGVHRVRPRLRGYLHRTAYLLCGDGHRAGELVQNALWTHGPTGNRLSATTLEGYGTPTELAVGATAVAAADEAAVSATLTPGADGPSTTAIVQFRDLARYSGWSVTASLSGDRTAWLEDGGPRRWLVEAAVVPALDR